MQPHQLLRTLRISKSAALPLAFLVSAFVLFAAGIVSGTAQSAQDDDREIEDTIPKHLPIKIKVKNADKVKDSKNEGWARDLEIEVENKSDRPIYYLRLVVSLPDVKTENNRAIAFPLEFGRGELHDYNAPLRPDDVPIRPGDSYIFRIPEQFQRGWERFVTRRSVPKQGPKKILLRFQMLNFGDGTGFNTTGGLPVDVTKKQAGSSCADGKTEEDEREIEDTSPKHMPIKFKVKNEGKVKDLMNENWLRDLEVEVENTSSRPIYFISFSLGMPEVKAPDGTEIGFNFKYGRINLIDYTVKAEPDDIPLLPGATYGYKIPEKNLKAWELSKAERHNPKKLRLRIHYINFGDGTGLLGDGTPVGGGQKVSSNNCSNANSPPGKPTPTFGSIQSLFLPATFGPVNFYPAALTSAPAGGAAARDVCCPGTGCARRRPSFRGGQAAPDNAYATETAGPNLC